MGATTPLTEWIQAVLKKFLRKGEQFTYFSGPRQPTDRKLNPFRRRSLPTTRPLIVFGALERESYLIFCPPRTPISVSPMQKRNRRRFVLAVAINEIVQDQQLSQAAAARRLNVNQPKVSALSNYQLDGFSVERLMNFLTALDRDVNIVVRRKPRSQKIGRILVSAA